MSYDPVSLSTLGQILVVVALVFGSMKFIGEFIRAAWESITQRKEK